MEYEERFTDTDLGKVVEQAMIYMCVCPAQVADSVRKLRELYRYQLLCIENPENSKVVHAQIMQSTLQAHSIMQDCLDKVIELEGWDRTTFEMPIGLRKLQLKEISSDNNDD